MGGEKILRGSRSRVKHFGYPIGYLIMGRHILLRLFEKMFYGRLGRKFPSLIQGSFKNSEALLSLPKTGNIFIFMHQPFIVSMVAFLYGNGFSINSMVRDGPGPESVQDLQDKAGYRKYVYKPVITLKILREKLLAGENVVLAADGKRHHYLEVRFGCWKLTTPKGPYMLSQSTGAPIVPLCLHLSRMLPLPKFEVRTGGKYFMRDIPEKETEKIGAIFSWYYTQLNEQPYMWNKIGWTEKRRAPVDPGGTR
jgi:hypothetical protein